METKNNWMKYDAPCLIITKEQVDTIVAAVYAAIEKIFQQKKIKEY